MWAIKILNGPQAGRTFNLTPGTHTIGRSSRVDIRINSNSISKIHAKIICMDGKVIISDAQSSNGILVNGVKIRNQALKSGDKFGLGDILFDIFELPSNVALISDLQQRSHSQQQTTALEPASAEMISPGSNTMAGFDGATALSSATQTSAQNPLATSKPQQNLGFVEKLDKYIDDVALPAVYKVSDRYDLKFVIAGFVMIFVIIVTTLTVLPVIQISRDFIVDESQRRAEALTRLLVQTNREYIVTGNEVSVSVAQIRKEPGVDKAYIVAASDGHIIAPLNQRGSYSKNPFLQHVRKRGKKTRKVMGQQIGVSLPILKMNPSTGEASPAAHAIVLYNMDRVALDINKALALIIQILLITILVGGGLYFFLYRVIIRPMSTLNNKLDHALKNSESSIDMESPTPIVQKLVANLNSALSRMSKEKVDGPSVSMGDKNTEASELVNMFPVAAFAYDPESELIMAANDFFNGHPLFDDGFLVDKYLDDLTDPSLAESLKDLVHRSTENPNIRHLNTLPTQDGERYEITIKAIQEEGAISYLLVSFTEIYDDEGDG